jgi:hypothetical protein
VGGVAEPIVGRHRVPVEHRRLGMDRRTFPFAIGALAVWLLWVLVVPRIDAAVPWTDQTRPGDVFRVTGAVTMTPAVGWGVQSGLRTTDTTRSGTTSDDVVLVVDGVSFQITSGPWAGTPAELLAQSTLITRTLVSGGDFRVVDAATTIQTRDGDTGVLEGFATGRSEGLIAALVLDGQGLQVQAAGTPEQLAARAPQIGDMIASITDDRSAG